MKAVEHSPSAEQQRTAESIPLLPVINVHFFPCTAQAASLFAEVAQSRQFTRAHVDMTEGGIPAAVQVYQERPTPELLVVESAADRAGLFQELAALAEVTMPETQVVVVGHLNDIELYRELLAEGVSDYIALPAQPVRVVAALASLFAGDRMEKLGREVVFMGAKGGVGSSIIAHNVAWALAEDWHVNTAVVDLDLAFGTAGLDFDVHPAQGLIEALESSDRMDSTLIDRLLHKCSERLMLLAAPGSMDKIVPIREQALDMVLETLRETVPLSILDMPSDWHDWMRAAMVQADQVVITATPELASLRNTKILAERIKGLRAGEEPPLLVLNQVGMGKRPEIPAAEFADAVGLEVTEEIPFDEVAFGEAALKGRMLLEEAPKSAVAQAIRRLAARIGQIDLPSEEKSSPFDLGSLLGKVLSRGGNKK